MCIRGVVVGSYWSTLIEIGVYVHSCVIQDIIVHHPVQRYVVAAVLLLPVVHFTVLLVWTLNSTYNKGMATFQVTPPENFSFMHPEEWPKWIRRFERFHQVSGLDAKEEETQVSNLIYCMGDEADDILRSFDLSAADSKYTGS